MFVRSGGQITLPVGPSSSSTSVSFNWFLAPPSNHKKALSSRMLETARAHCHLCFHYAWLAGCTIAVLFYREKLSNIYAEPSDGSYIKEHQDQRFISFVWTLKVVRLSSFQSHLSLLSESQSFYGHLSLQEAPFFHVSLLGVLCQKVSLSIELGWHRIRENTATRQNTQFRKSKKKITFLT